MKSLITLILAASLPVAAMAQSNYSFDDEVNAELEKMYQQSGKTSNNAKEAGAQVQVNVQTSPTAVAQNDNTSTTAAAPTASNANTAAAVAPAVQVQKQPTTVVEASPLQESKAELIRKSRQDAEIQTEQKIVEKLEASRLEDEKRRSDVLFGDKFKSLENKAEAEQAQSGAVKIENSPNAVVTQSPQQNAVVPATVVAPAPVVVAEPVKDTKADEAKKAEMDKEAIRNEVRASLEDMKPKEEKPKNKSYFSAIAGMGDYPDVKNVRGNYSVGAAFGQKINDRLLVEGSFTYSNYDVEQHDGSYLCNGGYGYYNNGNCTYYPRITNMDQYQGGASVKYQILGGSFRPYIGGIGAYSYRTFSDKQFGSASNNAQSHAVDLGLTTGVDFETSESFSLGLDMKYMFNIYSRANNSGFQKSFAQTVTNGDTPIEQLSYMTIGLVGRFSF